MSTDHNEEAVTPVVTLSALPLKAFSRGEGYAPQTTGWQTPSA